MPRFLLILAALLQLASAAPVLRQAAEPAGAPVDQRRIAGNACGPAALLNAFRAGSAEWRQAALAIPGETDREQVLSIIRHNGSRPSASLKGRARWSLRGVNASDLCDIGNELSPSPFFAPIRLEILLPMKNETPAKLLTRTHWLLEKSLAKGLPAVLSLQRLVHRNGQWLVIDAHFVTLTSLPVKLEKSARSFPVTYIDPWGGKRCAGEISLPGAGMPSGLEGVFPQSSIGLKLVKPGEPTLLILSAALGKW